MTEAGGPDEKPATVRVVIDGREIEAEPGAPLLQVALDHGIQIPHYCYHPKLSIDGSCRMCQVQIQGQKKLAIACNTPCTEGLVVDTRGDEVADARRGVMELLLVNHPLDCPICDQAGECHLQDYSFAHGSHHARTESPRRKGLKRHPIGPRVVFDQERCILCRRCVRFTQEITQTDELRVFGIGDTSHIGTLESRPLDNPYSVNVADICPVGALLSADFHHKRRVWFLDTTASVCAGCANGCNIEIGTWRNEIQRLTPRRNDAVNDTWMCDAGRLGYGFVGAADRIRAARVRIDGEQREVSLQNALDAAAEALRQVRATHGAGAIAIVGSAHLTNEECFRLAAVARDEVQTPHLDLAVPLGTSDAFLVKAEKAANARGARDMGLVPGEGGHDLAGIAAAVEAGEIRALWVVGSRDLEEVIGGERAAKVAAALEVLVVQDVQPSYLTAAATIVLPGATWAEKSGTFTNHAGRVQRIGGAVTPPEGVVVDGELFARLASALAGGAVAAFEPAQVFDQIAAGVATYAGLSHLVLGAGGRNAGAAANGEA